MAAAGALKIARNFRLPLEAVTQTFAILAKRGAGKSYTASVMCEEMLKAGALPVVIDPLGVWWGLRSSADGKSPGFPITVLGGDHGDVPLESTAGETVADFVVRERQPVILDLSGFRKAEQRRFVTAFAERLYQRNREPLHLIVDEADAFAPQRPQRGEEPMLGAMEDLSRRGRARGIGMTLVTQRSAVLNKNVLTQIEVLMVMRTTSPQDRAAIKAWVDVHGEEEAWRTMDNDLPKLPIGTAYLWSPGWLDEFVKIEIRKRQTFDSSATPKVGEKRIEPRRLAPVDLAALQQQMEATIEKAKKEDPKELRRRIAELEATVSKLETEKPEPATETIEVPVFPEPLKDAIRKTFEGMVEEAERIASSARDSMRFHIDNLESNFDLAIDIQEAPPIEERVPRTSMRTAPVEANGKPQLKLVDGGAQKKGPTTDQEIEVEGLAKAPRTLLATLMARAPMKMSRAQLSTLSGYKPRSSTYANALSTLRVNGLIDEEGSGKSALMTPSQKAWDSVEGDPPSAPNPADVREQWLYRLPQAPAAILAYLIPIYPDSASRGMISEDTGYSETSSTFANALSTLRVNGLLTDHRDKSVSASEHLF